MRLHFLLGTIIIGLVISIVACFQGKGLDIFSLHVMKCVVVKVAVMSIEENFLIVDSGGATYSRELVQLFYSTVSIHISRWCVVYYPFQWNFEVEILGVIFCLVHNDGQREAFPTGLGKYKEC